MHSEIITNEAPPPEDTREGNDAASPPGTAHPLSEKTRLFPHLPGVYLFRDSETRVIYVGKARDLRKRASSYFRSTARENIKIRALLEKATDLEFVVTSTEKEALLLESSFIKKHRPRYNVILRDDKSYPSLRIDPRDPFPRLDVVRRFQRDGALYFGPYPSGYAVRETLRMLNQLFPLRQCKGKNLMPRERPCLNYSLKRCLGACAGKVSAEEYGKMVQEVILFLQGKTDTLQRNLKRDMVDAAERLEFERAARCRDRLHAIESMVEKQHMISDRLLDEDVLGVHQAEDGTTLLVLFIRQGVLVGKKEYHLSHSEDELEEILTAFIQQFYGEGRPVPDEVLIPSPIESREVLQEWLSDLKGKKVRIWPVQRGDRKHLLDLAEENARERHAIHRKLAHRHLSILENLARILRLGRTPVRMGCVDISNIQGLHAVGAMAVFADGQPDKSSYRHHRIQGKSEPDDPAMMAEFIERLLDHESELMAGLDLLVLDGGKGQLNRIHRLFEEKDFLGRLPLIALAKEKEADRGEKGRGLYEKIYVPGRKNPIFLAHYPDILHLLQKLRDETHRFAVTNYQHLHRQGLFSSALDVVPGIGPRRRQALLKHFGSMDRLFSADVDAIAATPGIPPKLARLIHASLHSHEKEN